MAREERGRVIAEWRVALEGVISLVEPVPGGVGGDFDPFGVVQVGVGDADEFVFAGEVVADVAVIDGGGGLFLRRLGRDASPYLKLIQSLDVSR